MRQSFDEYVHLKKRSHHLHLRFGKPYWALLNWVFNDALHASYTGLKVLHMSKNCSLILPIHLERWDIA